MRDQTGINQKKEVTVCLTSCGRPDLLNKTLSSFYSYNTYPIKTTIVIDDYGFKDSHSDLYFRFLQDKFQSKNIHWIFNGSRLGQIKSIDKAYSLIDTEYIFHCEDDWLFLRPGFIEVSLVHLEKHENCIQLWLRGTDDTNGHPVQFENGEARLSSNYLGRWHGFSFNPSLKRSSDYHKIGSYSKHTKFDSQQAWKSESDIGKLYHSLGYYAAIVSEAYVKHLGAHRHIKNTLVR